MKKTLLLLSTTALLLMACKQTTPSEGALMSATEAQEIKAVGAPETQAITNPPMLPPPVGDREAKKVVVHLEATEIEGELADGVTYKFWTFNDTVPGTFIRLRVGDEVELHLKKRE